MIECARRPHVGRELWINARSQLASVHHRPAITVCITAMASLAYLDIYIGDKDTYAREQAEYSATCALLSKNAHIYGLPATPPELSEEQRDILRELDVCSPHLDSQVVTQRDMSTEFFADAF